MNKLLLEKSETILDEIWWRIRHGEIIETLPELDGYKRQMCSPLPEYETDALVKQIKCRRPFFFISGLYIAYTLISFIVWLITIIYLKLSGMETAISVRYNSIDGWDLSHPVWVSAIMVNLVIVFYIFFGMTILNIIKKFIIVIIKTYYKYKEEKQQKLLVLYYFLYFQLFGTYIGDNIKVKSNNDFINHLAEIFHNEIGVKIYD